MPTIERTALKVEVVVRPEVPKALAVAHPLRGNHTETKFIPEYITETLTISESKCLYEIALWGTGLTSTGKLHPRNRGEAHYRERTETTVDGRFIDELPVEIQSLLVGRYEMTLRAVGLLARP